MALNKTTLTANVTADINDNTTNDITAEDVRSNLTDMIDSIFDIPGDSGRAYSKTITQGASTSGALNVIGDMVVSGELSVNGSTGFELTANKNQPSGYAGLDGSGHIVGPVIVAIYANSGDAGVLPDGALAKVSGELFLGDGSTVGGISAGQTNTPIANSLELSNLSISLDPTKSGLYSFFMAGDTRTLTITNANSLSIGYRFHVVIYFETGDTMTIDGGTLSVPITGLTTGLYFITVQKILNVLDVSDWAYSIAEAASVGF